MGRAGAWLIDVEGDGPEAEASRSILFAGELVETMSWSSRRGAHHLLVADVARLKAIMPGLKPLEVKGSASPGVYKSDQLPGLELRIGGHKADDSTKQLQSVVPPTPGTDGKPRSWSGGLVVAPVPDAFYVTLGGLVVPKSKPSGAGPNPWVGLGAVAVSSKGARDAAWVRKALTDELGKLASAGEGNRNDSLNRAAYALGRFVPRYVAREAAEAELRAVADQLGLGTGETEATIRSGIEAGMANPKERPETADPVAAKIGPRPGPGFTAPADKDRPQILISTDEKSVNDEVIQSLSADLTLYCRGPALVSIRREKRKTKLINRPMGSPWIAPLPKSTLREKMAHFAKWTKIKRVPNSKETAEVEAHPPDWSVAAVWDRGEWDGIRHLEGVVEAPSLLADGSVLDKPGYDEPSGLIYEPNCEFPPIPRLITQNNARRAVAEVFEVVADFPFAVIGEDGGATHRAAWLASVLTPLARHAIDGPCPLFFIDANTSGAGKSKLVDIVATLATGRGAARTAFPDSDEEMRKQIISIALEGDRLILIDNVATGAALGGPSLDMVLTGTTIKGRVLGKSEMTRELPIYTVWYATGNNLGLRGDMLRRVVPFRLESPYERPEERTDFRIKGDLIKHVEANRARLVVALLTILRGFFLAGKPQAALTPMDYPAWSSVVRQAVYWASGFDPCETRRELIEDDPETNQIKAVVIGWAELPKSGIGLTAAAALKILNDPDHEHRFETLRNALMDWSRDGDLPGPKIIGKRLKQIKGRIIEGKSIKARIYKGTQSWYVSDSKSGGSGGSGGSSSPHASELSPDEEQSTEGDKSPGRGGNTPTKPTTPTTDDETNTCHGDAWEGDLPPAKPSNPFIMTAS